MVRLSTPFYIASDYRKLTHRVSLGSVQPRLIPIQPRNSTIQCFLLYRVSICMLLFAMRSAPIPAGVAGSALCASLASRPPRLFGPTSVATRVLDRFVDPLFSYCYELLFLQLLCLQNHLRCPLVLGDSTLFPTLHSLCAAALKSVLTPLLPHSCGLWVVAKKVNSFAISQIQTLFAKRPGWGYLASSYPQTFRRSRPSRRAATWTWRAHPTIIAATSRIQVHG